MSEVNVKIKQFRQETATTGVALPIPEGADRRCTRKLEPGEVVSVSRDFYERVSEFVEATPLAATRPIVFPSYELARFSSPNAPTNTAEHRGLKDQATKFLKSWAESNRPAAVARAAKPKASDE